ncbi:MAG: SRPBCC domain-containing protein [Ignavibacteriales bacterium]|nr:SRPBCC domain-containing protein [Ignavibacteriales bacterium]
MLKDLVLKKVFLFNAPADAVWDALTNPEKIKIYLFGTNAISDWKEGSRILFMGEWEGKQYTDKGTILKFEKNKLFRYNYWSSFSPLPDTPENYSVLTFTLSWNGTSTELSLEQEGFVDENARKHSGENWDSVMKMMKEIVEKR